MHYTPLKEGGAQRSIVLMMKGRKGIIQIAGQRRFRLVDGRRTGAVRRTVEGGRVYRPCNGRPGDGRGRRVSHFISSSMVHHRAIGRRSHVNRRLVLLMATDVFQHHLRP